jgi:ABC-type glycerol-3-phosphate transport system substrate-binding protein
MTDKMLTVVKIIVVVLFVVALGMGGWLLFTKVFGNKNNVPSTTGPTELVWWVIWEDPADMQVLADKYTQQNPNVTIKIVKQEVESDKLDLYKAKIKEQIKDQNGPDIIRIHHTWVSDFQSMLKSLPSQTMTESTYASTFYPTALTDFKGTDGRIYGIPLMFDGLGVYYNKTLLRASGYSVPAENWDDFLTQAKALTKYNADGTIKIAGAGLGTGQNIDFSFDIVSLLMLQEGSTIVDASGRTTFVSDTDLKAGKALKFYTDFSTRYKVWDNTLPRDIEMFAEGRLAMMFAPSWRVFDIKKALDSVGATLDYDIAPVPQQPSESGEKINWSNYWGEAVSAQSAHSDIAWDFLKFITEKEQLTSFYEKCKSSRAFGEIYPRQDMADDLLSEKYVSAYIKSADTARTWKMVNREKMEPEFKTIIENAATSGNSSNASSQEILKQNVSDIEKIIAGQ